MVHRSNRKCSRLAYLVAIALLTCMPAHAAKLYKWIDEDGQVRYSDRLPPELARERHQTLTRDGRVLDTKERAKTPEELRLEREQARLQAEQERLEAERQAAVAAEKAHHDRVLLMTFTSEAEIKIAQEERIDVINSVVKLLRKSIETEQQKLERLEQRAERDYINQDKVVPGGLAQNIEYFGEKLLNKQRQLELKLQEKERIRQQYNEDLLRYRELTQSSSAPLTPN